MPNVSTLSAPPAGAGGFDTSVFRIPASLPTIPRAPIGVGPSLGADLTSQVVGAGSGILTLLSGRASTQETVGAGLSIAGLAVPGLNILASFNLAGSLLDRFVFAPRRQRAAVRSARTFFRSGTESALTTGLPPILAARFGAASAISGGPGRFIPQSIDDLLGDLCPPGLFPCPAAFDPTTGAGGTRRSFAAVFSPFESLRVAARDAFTRSRSNRLSVTRTTAGLVPAIFQRTRLN